jgi:periplasmic protein CpxP/Spy
MSQQNPDHGGNWLKLSLVTLVVLNLALMASIWLPQLKRSPDRERGIGGREHDLALQFLEKTLKLTPEQRESTAKLRADHFLKADALRKDINLLRRQIMDEVLASSPDREKVERLAAELGQKQGSLEELTFYHFLNLYSLCQPQQKEKFRSLMSELLDRLKPQGPDAQRRRPEEGGQPMPAASSQQSPREDSRRDRQKPADERNPEKRQPPPGGSGSEVSRIENQVERLRDRLGLSAAQVEKLRPIVERFVTQIDTNRQNASGDSRADRQEEKRLKDQRDEAIESLLSGEQKILFQQMKEERRQNPPPRTPREDN